MSRQLFIKQSSQRSSTGRFFRFLSNLIKTGLASLSSEVFQSQVTRGRIQVSFQRGSFFTKVLGLANQAKKAIVRNVFSTLNRAQQPVSKTKNRFPVSIV